MLNRYTLIMTVATGLLLGGTAGAAAPASAAELARFEIREPLGIDWPGEWLSQRLELPDAALDDLRLLDEQGRALPARFTRDGRDVSVLFQAEIGANQTAAFRVVRRDDFERDWTPLRYDGQRVTSGLYELTFDERRPLPAIDGLPMTSHWPEGIEPLGVEDRWLERGPVRAVLERTFRFADPAHRYTITFDLRANDPWIAIVDDYALGRGSYLRVDLRGLEADRVFHHYSYNARTFSPGGDPENTTIQPPQHPIATLGPIWRDIWYNGGPFAFIYNTRADRGLGLATVRGSRWRAPDHVTLESQNLLVNGDREREGQVWVQVPTDAGRRHWAIVPGHADLRRQMPRMIRRHADIPLDTVLREWVLEWQSDAPQVSHGAAGVYLGSHFNRHFFNPTTYPRRVSRDIPASGPVKSRDLAVLAYLFTNPDYWPGPDYRWRIGNPNFHTDMYPIPFRIGLLMPEHPHAKRWVEHGVANLRHQIHHDSFPGGSWAESPGYSGAFFSIANYLQMAAEAGHVDAFRDWPRVREVAQWFACIQTPIDPRYGVRQMLQMGDTSPGNHIARLSRLGRSYRGVDDRFAAQLERFDEPWEDALDISSRAFAGFGATLRGNAYDRRHESLVAFKAGPARNHYQGDELSVVFHALGTPLAVTYACHYSPRPWHAAMHNRPDMNDKRPVAIGVPRDFRTSEAADVFVADERTWTINHVPLEPHHTHRPGWEYPTTRLPRDTPWTFRRYAMLVKHDPAASHLPDYLVLRDEIDSPEPIWWNLHMLARAIEHDGQRFLFPGQLDVDVTAHFLTPDVVRIDKRQWGWRGRDGGRRRGLKGERYERELFGAWIPEDFEPGTWGRDEQHYGEMAKWLRVRGEAGRTDWLVILMPNLKGSEAPTVERLSPTSARITLGDQSEIVHLGSGGRHQAAIERDGRRTVLLPAGHVRPWAEQEFHGGPGPGEPDLRRYETPAEDAADQR